MADQHTWTAIAGSTVLNVLDDSTLTMDESWAPFIQSHLTIPTPARAVLDLLDPRASARINLTLTQTDAELGRVITRAFDLGIRDRESRKSTGQTTLELASDEALLQDYRAFSAAAHDDPVATVITDTIQEAIPGATVIADPAGAFDAGPWGNDDLWSYAIKVALQVNGRVWCLPDRSWRFTADVLSTRTPLAILAGVNLIDIVEKVTRAGDWADGVGIQYSDNTITSLATGYSKGILVDRSDTLWDASSAAADRIRALREQAGLSIEVHAIADYDTDPGRAITVVTDDGAVTDDFVSKVTFDHATDQMIVTPRGWWW